MASYFGARGGSLTAGQQRTWNKMARDLRALTVERERARIARLTERDAVTIMGRVIADAAAKRGTVNRQDFRQAGVPEFRIDELFDRAMARARRVEPLVDGMSA